MLKCGFDLKHRIALTFFFLSNATIESAFYSESRFSVCSKTRAGVVFFYFIYSYCNIRVYVAIFSMKKW